MAIQEFGGWGFTVGLIIGPGLVAALLWSPFLLSSRLRSLYRSLPPAGSTVVSYLGVTLGLSLPYLVGTVWAITATKGGTGATMANALLDVILPITALYVIGLPIASVEGLPRLGIDWDETGYEPSTWVLLIAGAGWYAAIFAIPLFLIALILALPT